MYLNPPAPASSRRAVRARTASMESIERANVAFFSQNQHSNTSAQNSEFSRREDQIGVTSTDTGSNRTTSSNATEPTSSDVDGRRRLEDQAAIDSLPEVHQQLYSSLLSMRTIASRELNNDAPQQVLWLRHRGMPELGDATPADASELQSMIAYLEWQAQQPDQPTSEAQPRTWMVQPFQLRRQMGGNVRWPWERESQAASAPRGIWNSSQRPWSDVATDQIRGSLTDLEPSASSRQLNMPSRLSSGICREVFGYLEAMRVAHEIYSRTHPGELSPSFRLIWPMVPGLGDATPANAAELEFLMGYVEWQARRPETEQPWSADQLRQRMLSLLERLYRPTSGRTTHPWEIEPPGWTQGYRFDHRRQVIAIATSQDPARDDSQTDWVLVPRAPVEWEERVEGQVNRATVDSELLHYRDTLQPHDLHLLSSQAGHENGAVHHSFATNQARQSARSAPAYGTVQRDNAVADSETQEHQREGRRATVPPVRGPSGAGLSVNATSGQETSLSRERARTQHPSEADGPPAAASEALQQGSDNVDSEPELVRSMSWDDGVSPARVTPDVERGWTAFELQERHRAKICHKRDCEFNSDHQCDLQALATHPETYHGDDARDEDLQNSIMEVLVPFEDCGHSNIVRLERPMVCAVAAGASWRTSCGCAGFLAALYEFRRGFSLGRCVYCSYTGQVQRRNLSVYAVMTRIVPRNLG